MTMPINDMIVTLTIPNNVTTPKPVVKGDTPDDKTVTTSPDNITMPINDMTVTPTIPNIVTTPKPVV